MRPLRLTPEGRDRVADVLPRLDAERRRRLLRLVSALADGTWELRFWRRAYPTDPDVLEIRPDDGFAVLLCIRLDETDLSERADILWLGSTPHPADDPHRPAP